MGKTSKIQVSVIVPVYNVEKYLRGSLDSLVGQTLRDMEIICVDDGSTDSSGAILDEYAGRDPRVKAIHQKNAGAAAARNVGLDAAQGEYLFFSDPDDWCERKMLEDMLARIRRDRSDIVFVSNYVCSGDDAEIVGRQRMPRKLTRLKRAFAPSECSEKILQLFPHVPWNKLMRTDFIRGLGIRFQDLPRSNDAFFVEAALAAAKSVSVLDRAYYHHLVRRPGSLVAASDRHPLTGYVARDALRDFLRERGMFGDFGVSWAFAVFASAIKDISYMNVVPSMSASYGELRRRLRTDPDMAAVVRHPSFTDWHRQVFDAVVANEDERQFLLLMLADGRNRLRAVGRRNWKILRRLPSFIATWLRSLEWLR